METRITEIAERLKALREICDFTAPEMAVAAAVTVEEYLQYEAGEKDFSVTFLFNCAKKLGVDMVELMTGENPRLSQYSIVRKGQGLATKRRETFKYEHLAYHFRKKTAEPFLVFAPYSKGEQETPINLSSHKGQEFDFVLSGELKLQIEDNREILKAGDAVYYDSGKPHGMIALNSEGCEFLAIVIASEGEK